MISKGESEDGEAEEQAEEREEGGDRSFEETGPVRGAHGHVREDAEKGVPEEDPPAERRGMEEKHEAERRHPQDDRRDGGHGQLEGAGRHVAPRGDVRPAEGVALREEHDPFDLRSRDGGEQGMGQLVMDRAYVGRVVHYEESRLAPEGLGEQGAHAFARHLRRPPECERGEENADGLHEGAGEQGAGQAEQFYDMQGHERASSLLTLSSDYSIMISYIKAKRQRGETNE